MKLISSRGHRGWLTSILLTLVLVTSLTAQQKSQFDWQSKEIDEGIVWKTLHTELFDAQQFINVLEIDLRKRELTLVYNPDTNQPTSVMAEESSALAAVNAGFFDMVNGGSVTYLKRDGEIIGDTTKWKRNANLNGALVIMVDGKVEMEMARQNSYYTNDEKIDDVLITGSLLIDDGTMMALPDNSFVTNRHPRTSVGIVGDHTILLMTIDGRAEAAAGMTLPELQSFMKSLNCKEAINLDGGGSTTMWIGKGDLGVVNMPSDNRKFDHEGERRVSNILVVK